VFDQPEPETSTTDLVRTEDPALTPQERLAQLNAGAAHYVRTQRPANTLKAYAQDWKVWEDYTADVGIPLLSGTVGALTGYVVWLERGRRLRPSERDTPDAAEHAGDVAGFAAAAHSMNTSAEWTDGTTTPPAPSICKQLAAELGDVS
jgi:hypothetical protein